LKIKRIFIGFGVFIALLGIWFIWGYLEGKKALNEVFPQVVEGPGKVGFLALDFRNKYSRWPKNTAELQNYLKENIVKGDTDLTPFKNLTLTETSKKTLKIHFDSYNEGGMSTGPTDDEINVDLLK
jgi:hypothetical protein